MHRFRLPYEVKRKIDIYIYIYIYLFIYSFIYLFVYLFIHNNSNHVNNMNVTRRINVTELTNFCSSVRRFEIKMGKSSTECRKRSREITSCRALQALHGKTYADIQKHLYDEYPNRFNQKRLEMEQKQLPLITKLKKRRYK